MHTPRDKVIKYTVPSRVAISLYDLNGELGRKNGGCGFSLNFPRIEAEITVSSTNQFKILNLPFELEESLIKVLEEARKKFNLNYANITFDQYIPSHTGFGSKTATLVSGVKAYLQLHDLIIPDSEIVGLTKRGGTWGIGVNIFKSGGFVIEAGQSIDDKNKFQPSSAIKSPKIAPLIAHYDMPNWKFLVILLDLEKISGEKEKDFFANKTPLSNQSVERLARITLSQLLPSVIEKNEKYFSEAIDAIQTFGWKKVEREIYGEILNNITTDLKESGATCVGMSSMGAGLYVLGDDLESLKKRILEKYDEAVISCEITTPNNIGYEVIKKWYIC